MNCFLLFDSYGTLVELDNYYQRLQDNFATHGFKFPIAATQQAGRCEMRHYITHARLAKDFESWKALRHECADVLAKGLLEQNKKWDVPHDVAYQVLDASIVFHPFADTLEALHVLQERGVPMGVLSNWDYALPQVLRDLGLSEFFEFVIASAHFGIEKPDPEFFQHALREIGDRHPQFLPNDIYYIGDHYEKDVLAPRSVGMQALWLVRDQRDIASGTTHEAEDVLRLNTLLDLPRMLDALGCSPARERQQADALEVADRT